MTHKQTKFRRTQDQKHSRTKSIGINDDSQYYEERSRRALLLSSEDVERMAVESSRARFMMQLVSKPEETSREFGSYFRGQRNESNPIYVMTSHTSAIPIPKRIVPMYPSLVHGLKWSPSVNTYSEDSQTDTGEDENYICRCHKCKMKHCLGRGLKTEKTRICLRDNIMKFSDNSTMTPRLTEIGCGSRTPLKPTPVTSEVSMVTSDVVVKDKTQLPRTYQIIPTPILKKPVFKNSVCQNIENNNKPRLSVTMHEAVRDTNADINNDTPLKPLQEDDTAVPNCPNNSENSSDCEYVRKVIYNEGISDLIKKNTQTRYPVTTIPSMRLHSSMKLKRNLSKVSVMSKLFDKESIIPYGHRVHSKYHSDCKPSFTKSYRCQIEEDNLHRIESPVVLRRTRASKPIRCTRTASIRLPKKVLTSERDIEAFVDKKKSKKESPLSNNKI